MRAVMGLLLILGGVVMGYLVITGKLPAASTSSSTTGTTSPTGGTTGGTTGNPGHGPVPSGTASGGPIPAQGSNLNPLGLPTMQALQDMGASKGAWN